MTHGVRQINRYESREKLQRRRPRCDVPLYEAERRETDRGNEPRLGFKAIKEIHGGRNRAIGGLIIRLRGKISERTGLSENRGACTIYFTILCLAAVSRAIINASWHARCENAELMLLIKEQPLLACLLARAALIREGDIHARVRQTPES